MRKGSRPTIKDIAFLSGYSMNTVSRALRGRGYVSVEAKAKILQIAEKVGYYKDKTALSLRNRQTRIIGVVIVDNSNPFYADVLRGIEEIAYAEGYETILVNSYRDPERERTALVRLIERRVDGLIITSTQQNWDFLLRVRNTGINVALVGSHHEGLISVRPNDVKVGFLAATHLIQMGHKKIVMLNSLPHKFTSQMRLKGFLAATGDQVQVRVMNSAEGFENAYRTFEDFLKNLWNGETAVFCYNDIFAYAVIKCLNDQGLRVPENMSVVGVDDLVFSSIVSPPLTTVMIDRFELGRTALLGVLGKLEQEETIVDVELIVRNSVKRVG